MNTQDTKQGLVNGEGFAPSPDLTTLVKQAKALEGLNQWREAAQKWTEAGRHDDASACITIAEANERGDAYREDVKNTIGEEPIPTSHNINEWKKWHEDLREIYNRHYH